MQPQTVTLIVAGIGIGGTLGGIVVGHLLSRSWQREQWVRDKRNEEFRELLDALAESYRVQITLHAGHVLDADGERAIIEGQSNTMKAIRTRIFTADVVQRCGIEVAWAEAIMRHQATFDMQAFARTFNELRLRILEEALKPMQGVSRGRKVRS